MSIAVFVLPVLILAALALGVLVYYLCYKAAINRKLKAEESGVHVPMASMETVWKVVAVIAVVVMYCSLNSKIMNLQSELQNTTNRLYDEIMELRYELDEMQETAKKEASVIREVFYDFGEIDTETNAVEMTFGVIPKSYGEETEVTLNYGGESIALANDGNGRFSGSKSYPLYEEVWDEAMICVTENGVTTTEAWEEAPMGSMLFECLPHMMVMNGSFGYGKQKGKLDASGELYIVPSEKNAAPFQEMKLYVKNGDEIIDEIPMDDGKISFNRLYQVEKGDRITVYVSGVDEYGYLHERYVSGWGENEMAADITYGTDYEKIEASYKIYTPDGKVLTQ